VVFTSGQQFLQTFLALFVINGSVNFAKKKPAEAGSGTFCYEASPALSSH